MSTGEQAQPPPAAAAAAEAEEVSLLDQVIARDQADRALARPRS